jgi:hypothetical protein
MFLPTVVRVGFDVPAGWEDDPIVTLVGQQYHPKAVYSIRAVKSGQTSGNQATYDANGKLITGGLSAGTADKVSPLVNPTDHFQEDVEPFNWAYALDMYYGDGDRSYKYYRDMYIDRRPPVNPPGAPPISLISRVVTALSPGLLVGGSMPKNLNRLVLLGLAIIFLVWVLTGGIVIVKSAYIRPQSVSLNDEPEVTINIRHRYTKAEIPLLFIMQGATLPYGIELRYVTKKIVEDPRLEVDILRAEYPNGTSSELAGRLENVTLQRSVCIFAERKGFDPEEWRESRRRVCGTTL